VVTLAVKHQTIQAGIEAETICGGQIESRCAEEMERPWRAQMYMGVLVKSR
jgi:hypothetical protein